MRRDMKLIRKLLEYAEAEATGLLVGIPAPKIDDHTDAEVHYHIGLCGEAGLLHVVEMNGDGHRRYRIESLTWQGHEQQAAVLESLAPPPGSWSADEERETSGLYGPTLSWRLARPIAWPARLFGRPSDHITSVCQQV